jgi:hypothetical protein
MGGLVTPERKQALKAVEFHSVTPLDDGLVVQVVPDVYTKPDRALVAAISGLPNPRPIKYKAPPQILRAI